MLGGSEMLRQNGRYYTVSYGWYGLTLPDTSGVLL